MAIPLQAPTVEVQRGEYGAVEVESVLTVGLSNRRMTVECVAYNLVGISSDTFTVEVSGECVKHSGLQTESDLIMLLLNMSNNFFVSFITVQTSSSHPPLQEQHVSWPFF